jgi:hypothetical protein
MLKLRCRSHIPFIHQQHHGWTAPLGEAVIPPLVPGDRNSAGLLFCCSAGVVMQVLGAENANGKPLSSLLTHTLGFTGFSPLSPFGRIFLAGSVLQTLCATESSGVGCIELVFLGTM